MPHGPKMVRVTLASLGELFGTLPEAERTDQVRDALRAAYDRELQALIAYALAPDCKEPDITLCGWRTAGSQSIAEFAVSDLALPSGSQVNFHGQNTSRWKYAGAIADSGRKCARIPDESARRFRRRARGSPGCGTV